MKTTATVTVNRIDTFVKEYLNEEGKKKSYVTVTLHLNEKIPGFTKDKVTGDKTKTEVQSISVLKNLLLDGLSNDDTFADFRFSREKGVQDGALRSLLRGATLTIEQEEIAKDEPYMENGVEKVAIEPKMLNSVIGVIFEKKAIDTMEKYIDASFS